MKLEAINLQHAYPDTPGFSLQVEHLEIHAGEIHTLIGPNGSGKSTLLRLLAGIQKPLKGTVNHQDASLHQLDPMERAKKIAFLPQHITPLFPLTVQEMILQGRHPWQTGLGLPDEVDLAATRDAMQRAGLLHLAHRHFDTLSGGEQQRASIAAVLAQQPEIILLDEPTHFLDIHHQAQIFALLQAEAARGTAIFLTTHDLNLAGKFAHRMTLLNEGKVITSGVPKKILTQEILSSVYGSGIEVVTHPHSGTPIITPSISPIESHDTRPESTPSNQPSTLTLQNFLIKLGLFTLLLLVALTIAPALGYQTLNPLASLREMWTVSQENWSIHTQILSIRLPRIMLGVLTGIALAGAGAAFQSLLRNPLAEPYTLGIAGTASLGAVLAISQPALAFSLGPISGVQTLAFAFALINLMVLSIAARTFRWVQGGTGLLLTGVTLGLLSSGLLMLVRYLSNPLTMRAMDQWLVGGLEVTSWREILPVLPFLLPAIGLILMTARDLNHLELGEDVAASRGVNSRRTRWEILMGGSLATAAVVAAAGPIGFVGLLVPHLVRRVVGTDQRVVLPCSMLAGAALLVLADAAARSLSIGGRGAELPVGILTSLVGGPVFLFFLVRGRHRKNPSSST